MVNASVVGYIVSNMHIGMEEHIILVSPKAISSLYHYKTGRDISLYQPHTNFIPPSYQFYTYLMPILYLPHTNFIPTLYQVYTYLIPCKHQPWDQCQSNISTWLQCEKG
jgi:hypothetical protein